MWWWRYLWQRGDRPAWVEKGESLRSYSRRGREIDQIILHESVTSTSAGAVKVLKKRKLGVHFSIDRNEEATTRIHVPVDKACSHAGGGHNLRSVGIEIANSYYGSRAKDDDTTITAVWAHKKSYILPHESQMISLFRLIIWLVIYTDAKISFPGYNKADESFRWGRIGEHEVPGIMAHHRFHHADGLFAEHYTLLRSKGFDHKEAWGKTVRAASSGDRTTHETMGARNA